MFSFRPDTGIEEAFSMTWDTQTRCSGEEVVEALARGDQDSGHAWTIMDCYFI